MTLASDTISERGTIGTRPSTLRAWQKALLIAGLIWALMVVVPDVYRLYGQLAAFGFAADNDGIIYDVSDAPAATLAFPGEQVPGLNEGDRIVLTPGACWSPASERCRNFLAVFGGMGGLAYVLPDTTVTLPIMRGSRIADVTMTAQRETLGGVTLLFLALDELAAVYVIWRAFKLAWDRPGLMTAGFFLFAMWFNPGQYFAFYAWLQGHPLLLLTQEGLQALAQGAGYAGFLIFALRFPHDRTEPQFQGIERVALLLGAVLALLQLTSFTNVFGVSTEIVTRSAILGGYAVALYAFSIVWRRRKLQSPLDYQRIRWVLWGCAIGLPAFIFADSNEATSLWDRYVWGWEIWPSWIYSEATFEFGYLLCGVLAIFICEAVRRPRIVNISYELRGFGAVLLTLVLFALLEDGLHEPIDGILKSASVPTLLLFPTHVAAAVLCGFVAHRSTHATDHVFNRCFYHASTYLEQLSAKAKHAATLDEIDRIAIDGPHEAFRLASAALFRDVDDLDGVFQRMPGSKGWHETDKTQLTPSADKKLLEDLMRGGAVRLRSAPQDDECGPAELAVPTLAVPVIIADKLYAVAMFGPHETGDDLDPLEVKELERFVQHIAIGYETARMTSLENEVHNLRLKLAGASGAAT